MRLEDNYLQLSSMPIFSKYIKWVEFPMVYIKGYKKAEGWFSYLNFVKSKLENALDLHLPFVCWHIFSRIYIFKRFSYEATYDS